MLAAVLALVSVSGVSGDSYLNNPRGSNNKLSEQSNNAQNQNRLFDSENNAAAGYQIGDNCKPVCQDENRDYDESKEGAMQGTMTYYQGSELYVEWFLQHGCGAGAPNVRCQAILQYMCDSENPDLRDGTQRGSQNTAGGQQEPPTAGEAADPTLGQHEPLDFYLSCRARERNKGLYAADQNVRDDRGATATRQNANGNNANNRHGLECPEERDYYPYWHPTPWHDIAVLTEEPNARCSYYRAESQNAKAKNFCSLAEFNNQADCTQGGGEWKEQGPWEEPDPECIGGIGSRDNHNGNVRNGQPLYYLWTIPESLAGRCVLRLRYNITTRDFDSGSVANPNPEDTGTVADHFFLDARYNSGNSVISQDPEKDFLNLGSNRILQLQVNTAQYGRTFEDRTHSFFVKERPAEVPQNARIVNYNVRGRRGNIVQTYPSVEYDFVPTELSVEAGTFLHFQWAGSDANVKNNAGNGRQGTDRSNLVQVAARGESVPLPIDRHTLFFDAAGEPNDATGHALVDRFAYLEQDSNVACDPDEDDDEETTNCKQLNGASAYFDGGLVEMRQVGEHHVISTRNSDFSNRSQKATIRVTRQWWVWCVIVAVVVVCVLFAMAVGYIGVAIYALKHPSSRLFSRRYRPRVLRWLVRPATLEKRIEERRAHARMERQSRAESELVEKGEDAEAPRHGDEAEPPHPPKRRSWLRRCQRCCFKCGLAEQRLTTVLFAVVNMVVFAIGFFSNFGGGFNGSLMYPIAKGGGFMLDLNFAVIVLPTLKSLQTAMRHVSSSREWLPSDDPISFHMTIAGFIALGSVVHIAGHAVHMWTIASAPPLQRDPLEIWALSAAEKVSGASLGEQFIDFRYRCAPVTGVLIAGLMAAMLLTAMSCVRRATNRLARRLGGFNLFWRVHMRWTWLYVLLLLHAPAQVWIWLFFPALIVAVDRVMLAQRQCLDVSLRQVKLLPRDVIGLTFEIPSGFAYQAGQYIHLGWRGEFHPFTLSSAPEENCLSVHIRAPDALDWCSALRKHLTEVAPEAAAAAAGKAFERPRPGAAIDYVKCTWPGTAVTYCRPGPLPPGVPVEATLSSDTPASTVPTDQLPKEAIVLKLTGPFGAPAQKVWQFQTIMVVGAGIGVTPFASVLRSVQLRMQQRQTILGATEAEPSSLQQGRWTNAPTNAPTRASTESLEQFVTEAIAVPRRIYFYWIVRGQEEFDWFYDLLATAAAGPAKDIVNITLFLTGEIELSKVRPLPCASGQFFGRPNWGRIFAQNRGLHVGEHVGVFLCGSPVIGAELARQSVEHSDKPGKKGGTRFSFFKESF